MVVDVGSGLYVLFLPMSDPIAIIPARFASTRFPGKPLTMLLGKPMVEQVYRRCQEAQCFARIIVATDDERISKVVMGFGGEVVMTPSSLATGLDRIANAARDMRLATDQVVLNVQGDEPAIPPESLCRLVGAFDAPQVEMATLVRPLSEEERNDSDVVKVVLDERGRAMYFSRADIPFSRGPSPNRWAHCGTYGYRAQILFRLAASGPTPLEICESLEQLRAIGQGIRIATEVTSRAARGVDRPGDVAGAEEALRALQRN